MGLSIWARAALAAALFSRFSLAGIPERGRGAPPGRSRVGASSRGDGWERERLQGGVSRHEQVPSRRSTDRLFTSGGGREGREGRDGWERERLQGGVSRHEQAPTRRSTDRPFTPGGGREGREGRAGGDGRGGRGARAPSEDMARKEAQVQPTWFRKLGPDDLAGDTFAKASPRSSGDDQRSVWDEQQPRERKDGPRRWDANSWPNRSRLFACRTCSRPFDQRRRRTGRSTDTTNLATVASQRPPPLPTPKEA